MMVELRGANRDGAVLARLAWECAGALGEERGTASGRNWARVPVTASIRPHFYWRFPPLFVNTATFHGEETLPNAARVEFYFSKPNSATH